MPRRESETDRHPDEGGRRTRITGALLLAALAALVLSRFYGHREPEQPLVEIDAPVMAVTEGEPVPLHARVAGEHVDEGPLAVRWESSIDGPLGEGRSIDPTLSAGRHTIRVSVEDAVGQSTVDEVPVEVRPR